MYEYDKEDLKRFERSLDVIIIIMIVVSLITLVGCTRTVYMPVETTRIDTIQIHRTDTVREHHTKTEKLIVFQKDSTNTVLDDQGNVKSKESFHNKTVISELRDSLDYYRAQLDSLRAIKREKELVPYPVERPLTKWQRRFMTIGKVATGGAVAAVIGLAAYLAVRNRKNRNKG